VEFDDEPEKGLPKIPYLEEVENLVVAALVSSGSDALGTLES